MIPEVASLVPPSPRRIQQLTLAGGKTAQRQFGWFFRPVSSFCIGAGIVFWAAGSGSGQLLRPIALGLSRWSQQDSVSDIPQPISIKSTGMPRRPRRNAAHLIAIRDAAAIRRDHSCAQPSRYAPVRWWWRFEFDAAGKEKYPWLLQAPRIKLLGHRFALGA